MTDLELAKNNLSGHTICLAKEGKILTSELRGISPMMIFLAEGVDLHGFSVADLIVGKATAMLFVKAGIKEVFAKTLSESGKKVLEDHGIPFEAEILTEKIINRLGTDICPMEKVLASIDDIEEGYVKLKETLARMQKK